MSDNSIEPTVNLEVPPSLVFGEKATNAKIFPYKRPETGENGFTNFLEGIPSDYQSDSPNNLKARIDDVNAIGRIASNFHHYRQSGGLITYSTEVATMIKGYPKGAVLEYWDGANYRRVASLIENNVYDFVSNPAYIDGIHWGYADSWGKPYGIFVDPGNVKKVNVFSGGTPNQEFGWEDDFVEYAPYGIDTMSNEPVTSLTYWRCNMECRKSKWIRIESDSFIVLTASVEGKVVVFDDLPGYVLKELPPGSSRVGDSSNPYYADMYGNYFERTTGSFNKSALHVNGYSSFKTGYRLKSSDGVLSMFQMRTGDDTEGETYSSTYLMRNERLGPGIYMRAGSMIQLLYAKEVDQYLTFSMHIVHLKR